MVAERLVLEKIRKIQPVDSRIKEKIEKEFREKCPEAKDLGGLVDLVANYGAMRGTEHPNPVKKAMMLMVGDHGVAKYNVSAFPQEVTLQMTKGYLKGIAPANVMARHGGMDVVITDVGMNFDMSGYTGMNYCKIAWGTEAFSEGPAMTREQAAEAIAVGIRLTEEKVDEGYGLFVLAEMGIGNTTSSAAIAAVMCSLTPVEATGRGTGVGDDRLAIKRNIVAKALEVNEIDSTDALDVLSKVGGFEIGALAGVVLGAALRKAPVLVDGYIATAAALIAHQLAPLCREYMIGSHLSAEPAHIKMLEKLSLPPILNMGMRMGEGTGAALVAHILDGALEVYQASFAEES